MTQKNENAGSNGPAFKYLEKYAKALDSSIRIPKTEIRFGWDPLLGLIPVVGDAISLVFSIMLLYYFLKHGGTRKMAFKMGGNIFLDATIGSIPILGSIFDFFYKANDRNYNILKNHHSQGLPNESIGKFALTLALMLFVLCVISLVAAYFLIVWIIGLF
ncbi:MAG: DUF4112 domain-containing protein [Bacteroidota bacterium]